MSTFSLPNLLREDVWDTHAALPAALLEWKQSDLFFDILTNLKSEALYQSCIHGQGHIERTLLFSAVLACREGLSEEDTELLLLAASYHDVGRVDDSYDTEHGERAAQRIADLTGKRGETLRILQGAVAAHSRPDSQLEQTVYKYQPEDLLRATELARLLKDADGLDRVRIRDLDVKFLRHESAREMEDFAHYVFNLYLRRGAAVPAYLCPRRCRIVLEGTWP